MKIDMFTLVSDFLPIRLVELLEIKNVSAREASLGMGQDESYLTKIINRKALPSVKGIDSITKYFEISREQLFSTYLNESYDKIYLINEVIKDFDEKKLDLLIEMTNYMKD